jgi:hypothetical protein
MPRIRAICVSWMPLSSETETQRDRQKQTGRETQKCLHPPRGGHALCQIGGKDLVGDAAHQGDLRQLDALVLQVGEGHVERCVGLHHALVLERERERDREKVGEKGKEVPRGTVTISPLRDDKQSGFAID